MPDCAEGYFSMAVDQRVSVHINEIVVIQQKVIYLTNLFI